MDEWTGTNENERMCAPPSAQSSFMGSSEAGIKPFSSPWWEDPRGRKNIESWENGADQWDNYMLAENSSAQTISVAPVEPTVLGPVEPTVNPMMLHRLKLHFNLIYVSTSSASRFHLHFLELSSSSIVIPHSSFLVIHHPSSSSFLVILQRLITWLSFMETIYASGGPDLAQAGGEVMRPAEYEWA